MSEADRYFLPEGSSDLNLAPWSAILPTGPQALRVTLFADVIMSADDGTVHLLELAAANCSQIATSEADFWRRVVLDEEGWQLRQLADECRRGGKIVGQDQCYAFTQLPIFGGQYEPGNIWVCSLVEWISFTADIFRQTNGLPDGTNVQLRVED